MKEIQGYQIQISTNSNFKNPVKVTVGKANTKCTLKNQKAGMKYYIRIQAYRKYNNPYIFIDTFYHLMI